MSFLINNSIPERDLPVKSPSGAAMLRYVESGKSYSGSLNDVIGPIDDRIHVLEISQGDGVPGVANYADIATLFPSPTAGQQVDVLTDSDPAKLGRWGYIGGAWVRSADRVTVLGAEIKSVSDTLYAAVQRIGYADGVIPDGATAAGASSYTIATPVSEATSRIRFACYARAAGTVYVQVVSRAGDTNTVVSESAVPVSIGYNEQTVNLQCSAGQYVGFRANAGIVAITTGDPGYKYWSGAQTTQGGSYTDSTLGTVIFHVRLELLSQVATGGNVQGLRQDVGGLMESVNGNGTAPVWIGGQGSATPVTGSSTSASTYVPATPAPRRLRAVRARAFVLTPGRVTLRRFRKSGDVFTAYGEDLVLVFQATGVQEITLDEDFSIEQGDYYGITNAGGVVSTLTATSTDGYYSGANGAMSFTDATPSFTFIIQISVEFEASTVLDRLDSVESGDAIKKPEGFLIVFGLGESHMAGRGEYVSSVSLPSGSAYKFTRSTAILDAMADPTGNDPTALAGKGSCGPALAENVWKATHGATGVIFVNSGLGSSTIGNQWAGAGIGWTQAVADWNAATSAINAMKLPVCGVVVYLAIGSNDAVAGTSKASFKAGVLDLLSRVHALCGAETPIVLALTGPLVDGTSAAGIAEIQDAQRELARENSSIYMGWTGAQAFVSRGLMIDNVHFAQVGNDIMGRAASPVLLGRGAGIYPLGLS